MNPRGLLEEYVNTYHSDELKELIELNQQSKINIDYEPFNEYLISETGKDFWENKIYKFVTSYEEYYNLDNNPKNHISFKFINVPENVELHQLDATYNHEFISCKAMIKNITDIRVDLKEAVYECQGCAKQEGRKPCTKEEAKSKVKAFIQMIHHYRDLYLEGTEVVGNEIKPIEGYFQSHTEQ